MITYDEPEIVKKQTDPGKFVTNCLKCNYTCHYPCCIAPPSDKKGCGAMSGENCTVCPSKCHYSDHTNNSFLFETTMVKK